MAGFNLDKFTSWDELLLLRASFERSPDDLLYIRKFGKNESVGTAAAEDIWSTGGVKALPGAAETVSIVSTSAADDLNGTGAWYVSVGGVDQDHNLVLETVTLDGTTPVVTTNTFIAVNRVRTTFHGSGGKNAGIITLTGSDSSNVVATIPAGHCITQQSHFTVPAGYTLFTLDVKLSIYRESGSGARRGEVVQMVHVPDANATYRTITYGLSNDGGIHSSQHKIVAQTPAKSTLWFEASADANNTAFTSSVGYLLVRGDYNYRTEL